MTGVLHEETRHRIATIRDRYPRPRSAVLPALWELQHQEGNLSPQGMADIAEVLGLTASEVQAVATFYSMYFQTPAGKHTLLACINVSCALRGADEIVKHIEKTLGCPSGGTTADGEFTWAATVECLGACGNAPAMQIDHHFHENLTPESVDEAIATIRNASHPGGDSEGAGNE